MRTTYLDKKERTVMSEHVGFHIHLRDDTPTTVRFLDEYDGGPFYTVAVGEALTIFGSPAQLAGLEQALREARHARENA